MVSSWSDNRPPKPKPMSMPFPFLFDASSSSVDAASVAIVTGGICVGDTTDTVVVGRSSKAKATIETRLSRETPSVTAANESMI